MFLAMSGMAFALPVEVSSFEVSEIGGVAELTWTTRLEIDNDYFEIERSTDGVNFTPLAAVSGTGTTSSASAYNFTDASISPSTMYWYRIIQFDFDGSPNYFEVVTLETAALLEDGEEFSFFPTRPSRIGVVQIQGAADARLSLSMHSLDGRQIFQKPMTSNYINLGDYQLAPGMFVISVFGEGFVQRERILVTE